MCGIVGYLGPSRVAPILLSELRLLEYRGYDSAGVAIVEDGQLFVVKAAGKLANLEALLNEKKPTATVGIGHTRWATHGIPNDQNAHPHMDCSGTIAIVHNGIIENYLSLKDELTSTGHRFVSQTDTEVVSHLIEEEYTKSANMLEALQRSVRRLKGAYALGIINQNHPNKIYAVNQHYSLVVGLGREETFLASDSVAVCQYTNKILRLEQSEIAEIAQTGTKLFQFDGSEVKRDALVLDTNPYVISKEGYKHFLLKEIHEQPLIMRQTLSKYLSHIDSPIDFSLLHESLNNGNEHQCGVHLSSTQLKQINRILIVACGTAYYSGMVGKYIIEELCEIPCDVEIASEISGRKVLADKHTLAIAVSQSGETADTLAAIRQAADAGALVLGITNRPDSHLAQISPNLIVTECGIEVSVAATKTFIAQLTSFYLLALYFAEQRGNLTKDKARELKQKLVMIPAMQEQVLARTNVLRSQVLSYAESSDVVYIGRGINYPVALEGALKLKELSYVHASGYPAGELKHGPIAVLDSKVPVVAILVPGKVYDKTLSNAQEARARNAQMIAVASNDDLLVENTFDTVLRIPPVEEFFSPLLTVIPLQLMAYFIADYLGKDVDQPRNLAKSVTVE